MKRSQILTALFFVVITSLAATSAMAIQVTPTWNSPQDNAFNNANATNGQKIENVKITSTNSNYNIDMQLHDTPSAGTSYSVLMSTHQNDLLSNPLTLDATASLNRFQKLVVAFSTEVTQSGNWLSGSKNLHWSIPQNNLFSGATFWFAGQSYNTNSFLLYSQTKPAATPIPGAIWLLGSGIMGLIGLRRRNNTTQHHATA